MSKIEINVTEELEALATNQATQQAGEAPSATAVTGEACPPEAEAPSSVEMPSSPFPVSSSGEVAGAAVTTKTGGKSSKSDRRPRSLRSLKDQLRHLNFADTKSIRDWADNRLLTILHPEVRTEVTSAAPGKAPTSAEQ